MENIRVLKRNGRKEPLQLEKIHKLLEWAVEGLDNVSYSDIELKAHLQFYDGIKTSDIQEILAKTASDLISVENPNYQYVAARIEAFDLRKKVFGQYNPTGYVEFVHKMVEIEKYTEELIQNYTDDELRFFESKIVNDRDLDFTSAAINQLKGKYLIKDRATGKIYETPQYMYMSLSATMFINETDKEKRKKLVVDFYNAASTFVNSLPTPIMAGLRTKTKQFSSCVVIECDDNLDSINATNASIIRYISQKAGIGLGGGKIRAVGEPIRNGDAVHTGVIPFYKTFQASVKSCSQGGVRGGAATLYYPFWHYEIEDLIVLKNNKGTEDNRIRKLDYGIQLNKLFYKRLLNGEDLTLFSPNVSTKLYDLFFSKDQDAFEKHYIELENDPKVRKKKIKSKDFAILFQLERVGTGRIYIQNVDIVNIRSPFEKRAIRLSNLCCEIALPTTPLNDINDPNGEIALCTLSAFNLGKIPDFDLNNDEEMKTVLYKFFSKNAEIIVRGLDNLLSYQNYAVPAAKKSTMLYRPLGVGVINYAYLLAKYQKNYSSESAVKLTHHVFEVMQYALLEASCNLAKERGACDGFDDLIYAQGKLTIDVKNPHVEKLLEKNNANYFLMDWETLRSDLKKYGIRNATVSALMPSETSSQIANATNGIEPPRDFITVKGSKDGYFKQVVYGIENDIIKWNYEFLWDQKSPKGYIKLVGVMQKFIDQSISGNTSYNPLHFVNKKVSMHTLIEDLLFMYMFGWKNAYYNNINDNLGDISAESVVSLDDDCDTCKI